MRSRTYHSIAHETLNYQEPARSKLWNQVQIVENKSKLCEFRETHNQQVYQVCAQQEQLKVPTFISIHQVIKTQ